MIYGEHALIRTADPDDAHAFQSLYDPDVPRSSLLSRTREPMFPTREEIRELFKRKEDASTFYVVEDKEGRIRGFSALRTSQEQRDTAFLSEIILLFIDAEDYNSPIATEVFEWLKHAAFGKQRLNKLIAHTIDTEPALTAWLESVGFESNGIQREVLFTGGQWHNMQTFSLFNPDLSLVSAMNNPAEE